MKKFAFLITPGSIKELKFMYPGFRFLPDFLARLALKNSLPGKIIHIKNIQSNLAIKIEGYIILSCLLENNFNPDKIISACRLAERLGVDLIGLENHPALDNSYGAIAKAIKIPITTGDALTAWSLFEAVYRIVRVKKIGLKNSTLAIIGLAGPIGSLCAKKLSDSVYRIIPEEELNFALNTADIVINTGYSQEHALNIDGLKPGAILCDCLALSNILRQKPRSKNVTIIQGGLIKVPFKNNLGLNSGLPKQIVFASMAEAMLLALAGKFTNYSLGHNTNPDKLEEIADLCVRHGFEVWIPEAPLL